MNIYLCFKTASKFHLVNGYFKLKHSMLILKRHQYLYKCHKSSTYFSIIFVNHCQLIPVSLQFSFYSQPRACMKYLTDRTAYLYWYTVLKISLTSTVIVHCSSSSSNFKHLWLVHWWWAYLSKANAIFIAFTTFPSQYYHIILSSLPLVLLLLSC